MPSLALEVDQVLEELVRRRDDAGVGLEAALGARLADGIDTAVARFGLPWRAQRLGPRSGYTLEPSHPRDAAEADRSLDVELIDTRRVHMANRGVWEAIDSAGPACGVRAGEADVDRYLEVLDEFLAELTAS